MSMLPNLGTIVQLVWDVWAMMEQWFALIWHLPFNCVHTFPQQQHQEAVKHICCYLLKTKDQQGLTFRPNKSCGLECYVDPDYAAIGQMKLPMIPILSTLVHALVIALCMPVVQLFLFPNIKPLWHLARQKQAEYIALSSALWDHVISIMNLLSELTNCGFAINPDVPIIQCKVFNDYQSCSKIVFCSFVVNKLISIQNFNTREQLADMFTKPLPGDQFQKLSNCLMGWRPNPERETEKIWTVCAILFVITVHVREYIWGSLLFLGPWVRFANGPHKRCSY
jgi:hypothetical protein